jgi:hypothetical protein
VRGEVKPEPLGQGLSSLVERSESPSSDFRLTAEMEPGRVRAARGLHTLIVYNYISEIWLKTFLYM